MKTWNEVVQQMIAEGRCPNLTDQQKATALEANHSYHTALQVLVDGGYAPSKFYAHDLMVEAKIEIPMLARQIIETLYQEHDRKFSDAYLVDEHKQLDIAWTKVSQLAKSANGKATRNGKTTTEPEDNLNREIVLVSFDQITPKQIDWLWDGRIPKGMLTLVYGPYEHGKSFTMADIAARLSRGAKLPEDNTTRQPSKVIWFTFEDPVDLVVRPQLGWLGANLPNVCSVEGTRQADGSIQPFTDKDVPLLLETLEKNPEVELIVIDPIIFLLGKADSHKSAEVPAKLQPIADIAAKKNVAIVGIAHPNKSAGQSTANRLMGSTAFGEVPRSILFVGTDADGRRSLTQTKSNLGPKPLPTEYKVVPINFEGDDKAAKIEWVGPNAELTPEHILASLLPKTMSKTDTVKDYAFKWLRETLAKYPEQTRGLKELEAEDYMNTMLKRFSWRAVERVISEHKFVFERVTLNTFPKRVVIRLRSDQEVEF